MARHALEARSLRRTFGGIAAVDDVQLAVPAGEFRAIIGPNGAGKTTLFNLLAGRIRVERGQIFFADRDITRLPAHARSRIGIGRTFQINNVFPHATVNENVQLALLAHHRRSWNMFSTADALFREETNEVVAMVGLDGQGERFASEISYGDRRRLELAIALACRPSLLLLDEPTCGMSVVERPALVELIQRIRRQRGMTVILIEHDMDLVFSASEAITVMHRGRVIAEGAPEAIARNVQVQEVYMGEGHGYA
jgi:ABC-type branched-subunit amino acid transport system ATPase component